jgi:hypothetical protein
LLRFTRDSGVYRLQSDGHANAYQVFLERALHVLRPEGRLGLVLPWGWASDEGSAALRRFLFDRCQIDEVQAMDNRDAIFPIHRALRFVILHATKGPRTESLYCRFGVRDVHTLDRLSDNPRDSPPEAPTTELPRTLLERLSGPGLAIPHLRSSADVRIIEALLESAPSADSPQGWGLRFGRELNATEDGGLFSKTGEGLPVIRGRHLSAYRVDVSRATERIDGGVARRRLGDAVGRARLAYRDVAGVGNRMTLIAALVPSGVVTTHTLFCLKNRLRRDEQLFVCAVLNSYVANYLVRQRVGTHVTTALVASLPLPRLPRDSPRFGEIVEGADRLLAEPFDTAARAELEGRVAALYQIDEAIFADILETFPLVPRPERDDALAAFGDHRVGPATEPDKMR